MALINYSSREITLKVVYYGPGLSGKTTNLQHLHGRISAASKGKLISLATETDRTLFFDFMPVTVGRIGDFTIRFQLYTVPGQVRYNATRKLVLKGADAVVFVADSQTALREQNIESFRNMMDNLRANNLNPDDIPIVLQYNKRDLDDIMPVEELDRDLNSAGYETTEAVAISGKGVEETFQLVTRLLITHIAAKHRIGIAPPAPEKAAAPPPPPPPQAIEKPVEAPLPTPPPIEEPPASEIEEVPVEREPEFPALSELYGEAEVVETERSDEIFEAPAATAVEPAVSEPEAAEAPPAVEAVIPEEGVAESLKGIREALEDISAAINGLAAELRESRKSQAEIIDLLKKIENSVRPPGKTAKLA